MFMVETGWCIWFSTCSLFKMWNFDSILGSVFLLKVSLMGSKYHSGKRFLQLKTHGKPCTECLEVGDNSRIPIEKGDRTDFHLYIPFFCCHVVHLRKFLKCQSVHSEDGLSPGVVVDSLAAKEKTKISENKSGRSFARNFCTRLEFLELTGKSQSMLLAPI